MLSINTLGNNGRLGNQIFQYASAKGIAKNNNLNFCIPNKDQHELFNCFKLSNDIIINKTNNYTLRERFFEFDQQLFNSCPNNVDLFGYFQTEKYFANIKEEIISDLTFQDNIFEKAHNIFSSFNNKKIVSLHVRRGDYVNLQHYHGLCGLEYYKEAINKFSDEYNFLVFSDDIEWCKQDLFGDKFIYSENNSHYVDLCLMSMCSHNILANSSFSWWGAWLNQNIDKKVIAPKTWFVYEINTSDLYCKEWEII